MIDALKAVAILSTPFVVGWLWVKIALLIRRMKGEKER